MHVTDYVPRKANAQDWLGCCLCMHLLVVEGTLPPVTPGGCSRGVAVVDLIMLTNGSSVMSLALIAVNVAGGVQVPAAVVDGGGAEVRRLR